MKNELRFKLAVALLWLFCTLHPPLSTAHAQGTAFTYQGRLNDGGAPASGIHDLRFTIYDLASNGGGGATRMALNAGGLTVNGALVSSSDRNAKENFRAVDPREVLEKVAALPLSRWNYKEDKASEHLGPMARDFHAAFGVGPDNKHIATVDADGVALAAIQGLNEKVEVGSQKAEDRFRKLEAENAALQQTVNELKELMRTMNQKPNGGER